MNNHTLGPWAWQKFGNQYYLTAQHGMRRIIIAADHKGFVTMAQGNRSILDPVTPDLPDAKLIASAPELKAALGKAEELIAELEAQLSTFSKVVWELTDGKLSKTNYTPETYLSEIQACQEKELEDQLREQKQITRSVEEYALKLEKELRERKGSES